MSNTEFFTKFAENIYALKFDEKPDYGKLRFLLTKNLLDEDMVINNDYDWINKMNNGKFKNFRDQTLKI